MSILNIRSGKGAEVYAVLKEAFSLPDTVTHINIDIDGDGIYKVSVDYFVDELPLQPPPKASENLESTLLCASSDSNDR